MEPEAQQMQPFSKSLIERLLCAGHSLIEHLLCAGAAAVNRPCDALQFQLLKGPCHFKLAQGMEIIRRPPSHVHSPLQENLPFKKEHLPTADNRRHHEMPTHISEDLTCLVKPGQPHITDSLAHSLVARSFIHLHIACGCFGAAAAESRSCNQVGNIYSLNPFSRTSLPALLRRASRGPQVQASYTVLWMDGRVSHTSV